MWLLGFAATGYVFHDLDAADLRALGVHDVAYVAGTLAAIAAAVGYFALVVPNAYATGILGLAAFVVGLRASLFGVHWLGVRVVEARQ